MSIDSITCNFVALFTRNPQKTTQAARRAKWVAPPPPFTNGVMAKYIKLVGSASEGAVTSMVF